MTLITFLLASALETALNSLLFRECSLETARQRLQGKTLKIVLAELSVPLVLIFSENRLHVVSQWTDVVDCQLEARIPALLMLRDRQQLSSLMRSGALLIEGDVKIFAHFVNLLDLSECDPADWLAPYTGDVIAHGIEQAAQGLFHGAARLWNRQRYYLSEAVKEEWRLAPGRLEVTWWYDNVAALCNEVDTLALRLAKLESTR
ncbi:MAG: ubiquinone biosynthesis accessory factor UbiJ [Candidatus Malihini olakiniferum]